MTTIKERPTLFSGDMVRSILAGNKTQTRRTLSSKLIINDEPARYKFHRMQLDESFKTDQMQALFEDLKPEITPWMTPFPCPYGQPGERLWVRETLFWSNCEEGWCYQAGNDPVMLEEYTAPILVKEKPVISCIHMPREASRLLLEVVSVRVERLQDIGEADAVAEGIERYAPEALCYKHYTSERPSSIGRVAATRTDYVPAIESYRSLWEKINGPDSWAANPWVWVVEFKRVEM